MAQKTPTSNLFAILDTEPTRKERDDKNTVKTSSAPAQEVVLTPKQRSELKAKENEEKKLAKAENERQRIEFEKNVGEGFSEPRYLAKKTQRVEVRTAPKAKGARNNNNRPNNKQGGFKGETKGPNNANRPAGGNNANNAVNRPAGGNSANREGASKPRNNNFDRSNGGSPVITRQNQGTRQNKGGNYNDRKNNNPSGNTRVHDRQSQGKTSNKPGAKKGGAGQANWGESVPGEDASFASGTVNTPNVGVVSGSQAPVPEEIDAPASDGEEVEGEDKAPAAVEFSYDEFLAQKEKKQKELEQLGVIAKGARSLTDEEKAPSNFTHVQSVKYSSNEPWALSGTDKTATAAVGTTVGARKGATVLEADALQFRVAGPRPGGRGRGGRGGRGDDSRREDGNDRRNNNAAGRAGGERGRGGARGKGGDGRGKTKINKDNYPALGQNK